MSRSDWLNLAIFVVAVVYSLWNRRSSEAPAEPPDEPDPPPVPAAREDASASREARARAAELASEVATLSERLETLRGPVAVLRRVLAAQVAAPLHAVQVSLERGEAALTRGDDPRADLAVLGQRLYAIGIVAEARADLVVQTLAGGAARLHPSIFTRFAEALPGVETRLATVDAAAGAALLAARSASGEEQISRRAD